MTEVQSPADQPPLAIYKGRTVHARFTPFEQRFDYGLFMIDVDIDRLDEAGAQSAVFSVGGANLFSFRRKDHGAKDGSPLRPWAEDQFAKANVDLESGVIRLVSFPRHIGYKFAPISLWFGYGPDGALRGIIYEVNNTFGETHSYVAAAPDGRSQHVTDKNFHVSPFWDVTGKYRFTLRAPNAAGDLGLVIDSLVDGERIHTATIKAKRSEATTGSFLKTALTRPMSTLGVTLGIHWEALKLWLKGAGYRSRPALPENASTVASPAAETGETTVKDAA